MPRSEEETYSTMFASLRHPARRKILRMLSGKPRSFSEMLEELGISSSHLTYHLESLGELVFKMEDGGYRLSAFGEAAVATMSRVEETPKVMEPRRPISPGKRVSASWVVLVIGIVVLASVCLMQYRFFTRLSEDYGKLKAEHDNQYRSLSELSAEYEQLRMNYEVAAGERPAEPWERTPDNVARLEDVVRQAVPLLEWLVKEEGLLIWEVRMGVHENGREIVLFVDMGEIRPEYSAILRKIFGWDVPIQFFETPEELWLLELERDPDRSAKSKFGPWFLTIDPWFVATDP